MATHAEYANGLRAIADFVETHPELHLPNDELCCFSMDEKAQAAAVLLALKPCKKNYGETVFYITREFGPVTLKYYFNRNSVCTPRVVGKKIVPAEPMKIIDARPEHEVDIIEWDCEPILTAAPKMEEVSA